MTAPAIRLVDEMGHEVSDRYYKLGSSVDITCQVALSFLNTIPSPTTTNSNDRSPLSLTTALTTRTIPTTTTFPFIDINLIKKSIEQQQIPYSGKHKIKWKKDGKELPKDIKINLRLVRLSLWFCCFDHVLRKGGQVTYFICNHVHCENVASLQQCELFETSGEMKFVNGLATNAGKMKPHQAKHGHKQSLQFSSFLFCSTFWQLFPSSCSRSFA